MGHLAKLLLALCLGVVAAAVNWIWLSQRVEPELFVAAGKNIERSETLTPELLKPVGIPGDAKRLRETFIPYEERFILSGRKAPRDLATGDMLFYRDLEAPEASIKHEELGPFRLLSVGSNYTSAVAGGQPLAAGGSDIDTIYIAVPFPYDEKTERLMKLHEQQNMPLVIADGDRKDKQRPAIVGLHVLPSSEAATTTATPGESINPADLIKPDERGTFISLRGVENIPRVLLSGQQISFSIIVPDNF